MKNEDIHKIIDWCLSKPYGMELHFNYAGHVDGIEVHGYPLNSPVKGNTLRLIHFYLDREHEPVDVLIEQATEIIKANMP